MAQKKTPEPEPGAAFGLWRFVSRDPVDVQRWIVRCACGKVASRLHATLRFHRSTRCGSCASRDPSAPSHSPEYTAWISMNGRCRRRSLPSYGGRGISVCREWTGPGGFLRFFASVGPRPSPSHSLDRIDNNGNYCPGNVRWATKSQQSTNTRQNRHVTAIGKTMTIGEWARESGLCPSTIAYRLGRGMPPDLAISPAKYGSLRRLAAETKTSDLPT